MRGNQSKAAKDIRIKHPRGKAYEMGFDGSPMEGADLICGLRSYHTVLGLRGFFTCRMPCSL